MVRWVIVNDMYRYSSDKKTELYVIFLPELRLADSIMLSGGHIRIKKMKEKNFDPAQ